MLSLISHGKRLSCEELQVWYKFIFIRVYMKNYELFLDESIF